MKVCPDTNVWIAWTRERPQVLTMEQPGRPRVFLTTIALQELWAGARSAGERAYCDSLYALARRAGRLLNPPGPAWILAGQALHLMARKGRLGPARLRTLRNDVLLAATAMAYDAAVLTRNRADFALIAEVLQIKYLSP